MISVRDGTPHKVEKKWYLFLTRGARQLQSRVRLFPRIVATLGGKKARWLNLAGLTPTNVVSLKHSNDLQSDPGCVVSYGVT